MSTFRSGLVALALVGVAHLFGQVVGCATTARTFDAVNNPADDLALARCREEGRAYLDAGHEPGAAFDAYVACRQDAGVK